MSEEDANKGEEKKAEEKTAEPNYTAEEQEALDAGWKPEGKDKDGNTLAAAEWMARKPLFNKIHNLKDEQQKMNSQMNSLRGDMKKMTQVFIQEKSALLEQLKEQRTEALDNLETDQVKKLDKQIESVSAATQDAGTYTQRDWSGAFIDFVKQNDWYDKNPALKSVADILGQEYTNDHPNLSPQEIYNHISSEIKKEFPDRFEKAPSGKQAQQKVSSSKRRASSSAKKQGVVLSDLPSEEQKVIQVMAGALGKTTEEYLKNYEL